MPYMCSGMPSLVRIAHSTWGFPRARSAALRSSLALFRSDPVRSDRLWAPSAQSPYDRAGGGKKSRRKQRGILPISPRSTRAGRSCSTRPRRRRTPGGARSTASSSPAGWRRRKCAGRRSTATARSSGRRAADPGCGEADARDEPGSVVSRNVSTRPVRMCRRSARRRLGPWTGSPTWTPRPAWSSRVAGVETVLALRALAGDRVTIELVAPGHELVHRPLAVLEPFDQAEPQRLPFARLEATHGVHHRRDLVVGVDVAHRLALLAGGGEQAYDVLVVATGARPIPWLPSALTFTGSADVPGFREVLDALEKGRASHVLFATPPHVAWSLPLYELALLTTTWLVDHDIVGARLTLATPDPEPLSAFGATASRTVRDLLSDRGIELVAGVRVPVDVRDGVVLGRLGHLHPDRIVTLPRLVGHPPAGLQGDADGFIPVDDLGAVLGVDGVY